MVAAAAEVTIAAAGHETGRWEVRRSGPDRHPVAMETPSVDGSGGSRPSSQMPFWATRETLLGLSHQDCLTRFVSPGRSHGGPAGGTAQFKRGLT